MKVAIREDIDPKVDFYYRQQFKIYRKPYLIWDRETWEAVLTSCDVYRIEADGKYAGDVVLEQRGRETTYMVDFSLLPEYQGKGVGKATLQIVRNTGKKLLAVTRTETLGFFLKSGFVLKKRLKNYYDPGVDGYLIVYSDQKKERPTFFKKSG